MKKEIHLELFNYKEANSLWDEDQKKLLFNLFVDLNLISCEGDKRALVLYGLNKQIKGIHDAIRECKYVKTQKIASLYKKVYVDKALLKFFGIKWSGSIKVTKSNSKQLSEAYLSAKKAASLFLKEYKK